VLGGAAASLGRQHEPSEAAFSLACLVDEALPSALYLAKRLSADGHDASVIGIDGIRELLDRTAARLQSLNTGTSDTPPSPHYLVLYGVDAAHTACNGSRPAFRRVSTTTSAPGWLSTSRARNCCRSDRSR
jgi:hypothetical protein